MSTAMDIFLNASDSMSFMDVLDIDIKAEMDLLVESAGMNDFSGFSFNTFDTQNFDDPDTKWLNSSSNQSFLDFSGDDGPTMVNPNTVLPVMSLASAIGRSPSPAVRESHLTFSPATIKIASIRVSCSDAKAAPISNRLVFPRFIQSDASVVKKDLLNRLEAVEVAAHKPAPSPKSLPKVIPILAKSSLKPLAIRAAPTTPTIVIKNALGQITTPVITQVNSMTIRTVPTTVGRKSYGTPRLFDAIEGRAYPKPAYSYSCLIAMALKNSKSGSLPVSEIYSFMCQHFPYFKTAPNGWKNSVRHNLSLNKCFEKIEKPALNGAQRKGCLWAMNPAKIGKMDEEVQKWSRKDPAAIKRAMVNPENLDALERGEMKFSCVYDDEEQFADSGGSVGSGEGSDLDIEEMEEAEVDVGEMQVQYIQVKTNEFGEYQEVKPLQTYEEEDLEEDKELLRMEMALAQKELEYEKTGINSKRRRNL
ncbi:hypothetical protein YQE_08440, partial [Dendroctonus ponderosae]